MRTREMLSDDKERVDMQTYAKIKLDKILNLEGRLLWPQLRISVSAFLT